MQHRTNQNRTNQNRYESNASNLRSFRRYDYNQVVKLTKKLEQSIRQSQKEGKWWNQSFGIKL